MYIYTDASRRGVVIMQWLTTTVDYKLHETPTAAVYALINLLKSIPPFS